MFRVDWILTQPVILEEKAQPKARKFEITHYSNEVFWMYDTEEVRKVTLCCENSVMKGVTDKFGTEIKVKQKDKNHFLTKVSVCTFPHPLFMHESFSGGRGKDYSTNGENGRIPDDGAEGFGITDNFQLDSFAFLVIFENTNKKENLSILFNTRTMRTLGVISAKALFELTL